jgi:hypothetical protein
VNDEPKGQALGTFVLDIIPDNSQGLLRTDVTVLNLDMKEQIYLNTSLVWSTSQNWHNALLSYENLIRVTDPDGNWYLGDYYSASNTDSARSGYVEYPILGCPGDQIKASLCADAAYCSGDTMFRFVNSSGYELTENNYDCGRCSSLSYLIPNATGDCQNYTLRQGCYENRTCAGRPRITNPAHAREGKPSYYFFTDSKATVQYGSNNFLSMLGLNFSYPDNRLLFLTAAGHYGGESVYHW